MFGTFFGAIADERIGRLKYLGYLLLLAAVLLLIGLGMILFIGVAEQLADGDMQQAQARLIEKFGGPFAIFLILVGLLMVFAHLNLMAKRARDIGFSGWLTVAVIIVVTTLVSRLISEQVGSVVNSLFILALLLIPGGMVSRGQ